MDTEPKPIVNCPFFYVKGCQWYGLVTELADHFVGTHKTAYATNPIIVELNDQTIHEFIVILHNKIFFVQLSGTSSLNKVDCLVKCLRTFNTAESHMYEYHIELQQQNLQTGFLGKMLDIDEPHQMQTFDFRAQGQRNTQKCKVTISRKAGVAVEQEEVANRDTGIKLKLCEPPYFNQIRCPVCINDPDSSIFTCAVGHMICRNCISNIHDCSSCRSNANAAEDNTLKELTESILYPCKYVKYGCLEMLTSNTFDEHVIKCSYKALKCPDEVCGAEIKILDVHNHFDKEHLGSLFNENIELAKDVYNPSVTYNWNVLDTNLFVLGVQYQSATELLMFDCIQLPKNGPDSNKYAFKLKFPSKTDANLKFSVRHICKTQFTDFGKNPVIIPLQMFEPYIINKLQPTVYFKCLIKKM